MLLASSCGATSSDRISFGTLDADGKLSGCPKALEPFEAEACVIEVSSNGAFVLTVTRDGLCVVWSTASPQDQSIAAASAGLLPRPPALSVDTGVSAIRTMWLPLVPFPADTPPRYGIDATMRPGDDDESTAGISPAATESPLMGIRRTFSKGMGLFSRKRPPSYQAHGSHVVENVRWARISDDGTLIMLSVTASPEAAMRPAARDVLLWRSASWNAPGTWTTLCTASGPGTGTRFPHPSQSSASSVLDAAFVSYCLHGPAIALVDVRVNSDDAAVAASFTTRDAKATVSTQRPQSMFPVLDVLMWTSELPALGSPALVSSS